MNKPKSFMLLREVEPGDKADDRIELGNGDEMTIVPVDLGEFVRDNDFEPEQVNEIGALAVDEEIVYGGGAAPVFILRRVA
jgi:hypothetical protein